MIKIKKPNMKYLPPSICFLAAGILIFLEKEGWGWLIFIGLILGHMAYDVETESINNKD